VSDLFNHRHRYIPVKYFLNSYRACSDGLSAVRHLEELVASQDFFLSDWKVRWIGACAILRTAITLFQKDAKSCIDKTLRAEIFNEWSLINRHKDDHPVFWEFLKKERDNIIHAYEWGAYQVWMAADGSLSAPKLSLLSVRPEDTRSILLMRGGHFKGRNSLEIMTEAAQWVEARIFAAIERSGYKPDEYRNVATFQKPVSLGESILYKK
jgi:hypothetical protein